MELLNGTIAKSDTTNYTILVIIHDSIITILNAGIKIITTAHGFNISELKSRREVLNLIEEKVFERYIVLSSFNGPGTVEEIIDGTSMDLIYKRKNRRACL